MVSRSEKKPQKSVRKTKEVKEKKAPRQRVESATKSSAQNKPEKKADSKKHKVVTEAKVKQKKANVRGKKKETKSSRPSNAFGKAKSSTKSSIKPPKHDPVKPKTPKAKAVKASSTLYFKDEVISNSAEVSSDDSRGLPGLQIHEYKHAYEDPNWLGNEDEAGSVASGVLEEDFCCECGLSTLDSDAWSNVIICDVCEGEYHLHCLKMDRAPRSTFVCVRCIREVEEQKGLKFNVSDIFRIPKHKSVNRQVIYTPARPLGAAFHECQEKGLMVVSSVFSYDIMRVLTHGTVHQRTKSGRLADTWQGATVEIPQRLSATTCNDMVDREGRFDLKIPDFVVEQLQLVQSLEPILSKLRTIMGSEPQLRTHNVVFAPVGSKAQQWHTDDSMKQKRPYRYFTILIHLNSLDNLCGGTEVWSDKGNKGDLIRARPGDALVFSGSLLHRGLGNQGYSHRFFYYASFACGADMNVDFV